MIKVRLSKRLKAIADMIDNNSSVADIGCDHALLDIYLIQNNIINKAIASDITIGAVNQAKKNVLVNKVNNIEVRIGDGLNTISEHDNIDTIVLSGLGSKKIKEILSNNKSKLSNIKTIIIQSNNNVHTIRKALLNLGYYISSEKIVKDNDIIYVIIKFQKGKKKYRKKDLLFGPFLSKEKNELYIEYYNNIIIKNNDIIKKIPKKLIIKKLMLKYSNRVIENNLKKLQK